MEIKQGIVVAKKWLLKSIGKSVVIHSLIMWQSITLTDRRNEWRTERKEDRKEGRKASNVLVNLKICFCSLLNSVRIFTWIYCLLRIIIWIYNKCNSLTSRHKNNTRLIGISLKSINQSNNFLTHFFNSICRPNLEMSTWTTYLEGE